MRLRGFYFITDSGLCRKSDQDAVSAAVEGGCSVVQYREKNLTSRAMIHVAGRIREITRGRAVFLVNDRVGIAMAVDADGVHLGQEDTPLEDARRLLGKGKIIGVTVHNVVEAVAAKAAGADYLAVSPIFQTTTKADAGKPAGVQLIRDVKAAVDLPVAAIGGINEANVDQVMAAGADMVCAISATVAKDDIKAAVEYFSRKFR